MLFNPRWDDPSFCGVSLSALIKWLEQQPADRKYDFLNSRHCAIAQYLQAQGRSVEESVVSFLSTQDNDGYWLFKIMHDPPHTLGAALHRAYKTRLWILK